AAQDRVRGKQRRRKHAAVDREQNREGMRRLQSTQPRKLFKSRKGCIELKRLARSTPRINWRFFVCIAHCHTRIDDQVLRQGKVGTYGFMEGYPSLLRTRMKAISAREQHHGLQIATKVSPLRNAERPLKGKENCHGSPEELIVPCILPIACGFVL